MTQIRRRYSTVAEARKARRAMEMLGASGIEIRVTGLWRDVDDRSNISVFGDRAILAVGELVTIDAGHERWTAERIHGSIDVVGTFAE